MAKARLIEIVKPSGFISEGGVGYTLVYEKTAWYYFGRTKTFKNIVYIDAWKHDVDKWLKSLESKMFVWREL